MIPKKESINESHHKPARHIAIFFISIFLLIIILIQYASAWEKKLNDKIYPNVLIDNTNAGWKTKSEAAQVYKTKNEMLKNFNLEVVYNDVKIATLSAEKLNVHSNGEEIIERAYLIGRTSHTPSRFYQKVTTLFNVTTYPFHTKVTYDNGAINEFIADTEEQYNKPAKNALFTFENGKVVAFREDEKGVKINSNKFKSDIESIISSLNKKIENKTIVLSDSAIEPEITLKNSNDLGIEELIGEGRSNYTHSMAERIHNINLAASKFNGVLIPKGKMLSFNEIIGDISSLTGYKPAYIIKSGRTVLGDGGGVCQVSTTLFRAALNSGLPIVERTAHAYRVVYYENDSRPGFDATIFSPSVDLKIKNDTPGPILILTENDMENNILTFKIYGKKDGRLIEISDATVYDEQPPPPPLYQDDGTLKKGVVKQVDYQAWGASAYFTYKVSKDNQTLFEKKFSSYFKPWQAVYLVGTAD